MSTGAVRGCSLDWPAGPKDSACAVNRTSKQQRSKVKTCLDNFMAYSPVQKWDHSFGVKPVLKHEPLSTASGTSLAAQRPWRHVIVAGQVFQRVEVRFFFSSRLLEEFN